MRGLTNSWMAKREIRCFMTFNMRKCDSREQVRLGSYVFAFFPSLMAFGLIFGFIFERFFVVIFIIITIILIDNSITCEVVWVSDFVTFFFLLFFRCLFLLHECF